MKQMTWNNRRGMTLTELLAVLLILSLLTTIAVPVYVARQEDARVRVAMTDCRQIAQAEDTVAAMHGFYVPFQLLDELPDNPDNDNTNEERIDVVNNSNNIFLINPTIRAIDQFNSGQIRLSQGDGTATPANPLATKLVNNWAGPFISFQRFWYDTRGVTGGAPYDGPSDPRYKNDPDLFRDYPLDPWGNPYRFYSPIGIIGTGNDERGALFDFINPDINFSNGELVNDGVNDRRFQRYAVVSFGRDGLSDTDPLLTANTPDNDIFYEFGTDGVSQNFGKF